jgi:hypothetical protein
MVEKVGRFEILAPIGAGGMGRVYHPVARAAGRCASCVATCCGPQNLARTPS